MGFWNKLKAFTGTRGGWVHAFLNTVSPSGKSVTKESTLQLSAAWACIRITAQAISSMSLDIYEKSQDGGRKKVDTDLSQLLTVSPNADQTAMEFWEGLAAWMCTEGNGYALKETMGDKNRLVALLPLDSPITTPFRDANGDLQYRVNDRGQDEVFPAEKIFHLRGFGYGGDIGMSPIRYGVNSLGAAISTEESAGRFFANGMQASGVLSTEMVFSDEQRARLEEIAKDYSGSNNTGKVPILEGGIKYSQLALNPEDAQMLETRRFNVEEICRWFGVPPIVVGHAAQGQTMWGSGVEQILIAWLTLGLNPYLTRIEQRIRKSLMQPSERRSFYAEYNRESLLQADSAAKAAFLSTVTNTGLMTRNEGREKLNLPPIEGGDQLMAQLNMAPISMLGAQTDGKGAHDAP